MLYHLHSLGAAGVPAVNPDPEAAEPSGRGLRLLQGWLDHVRSLDCGGVLLTPIFAASTHGYDTIDPFRIDPGWGRGATSPPSPSLPRARPGADPGRRLNHVGRAFPAFQDVLAHGAAIPVRAVVPAGFHRGGPDGFGYADFEGHPGPGRAQPRRARGAGLRGAGAPATGWTAARTVGGWTRRTLFPRLLALLGQCAATSTPPPGSSLR